jgi:hypothetical protein
MSIAAVSIAESAIGGHTNQKPKSTKAPTRRQYVVKSDAVVAPEPR